MRRFNRESAPDFLESISEQWGKDWADRKAADTGAHFSWRVINQTPLNQLLQPHLQRQTQKHCSYCDNFPVSPPSRETIDHFRPKADYPLEASLWSNLYFCCDYCQQRLNEFSEQLIRPDDPTFSFNDFFIWNFDNGEIIPNPAATPVIQERAKETIRVFRLNEGHPSLRKRAQRQYMQMVNEPSDSMPYRHFIAL